MEEVQRDGAKTLTDGEQESYDEGDNEVQITYTGATLKPDTPAQSVHHPVGEQGEQLYTFGEHGVTVEDYTWPRLQPTIEHTFKFKNPSAGLAIELTPTYIKYTGDTIIMPTQNTCYSSEGSNQEQNEAEFRSFVDSWGAAMACTDLERGVLEIHLHAKDTQAMIDSRSDMYRDKTAAFIESLKASKSKWSQDTGDWETRGEFGCPSGSDCLNSESREQASECGIQDRVKSFVLDDMHAEMSSERMAEQPRPLFLGERLQIASVLSSDSVRASGGRMFPAPGLRQCADLDSLTAI